jgi:predicted transcriptional regulator
VQNRISPDRISDAERAVMEVLWDLGRSRDRQYAKVVCEKRDWSRDGERCYRRLVKKKCHCCGLMDAALCIRRRSPALNMSARTATWLTDCLAGAASLVAHLAETSHVEMM